MSLSKLKAGSNKVKGLFLAACIGASNMANAALPATNQPQNQAASGDYIGLFKGYAHDILLAIGLILGGLAFTVVAKNMIAIYGEIGSGKKTWGDMGMHGGMGVLLLVFIIYLLTEASTVIFA